jgi:conjugative transfer region protein TrbK
MDGKMLARLGAVVFVGIAITAAVIEFTRQPATPELRPQFRERNDTGDLRQRLRRCRDMGEAATHDPACLKVWAENRDRFLKQDAQPSDAPDAPDAPTTLWPPALIEDPIVKETEAVIPPEPARPPASPDEGAR